MPRKQAQNNDSSAGAAAARAANPKTPRVKSAKHTKAAAAQDATAPQIESMLEIEVVEVIEPIAIIEVEEFPVETSLSASAAPRADADPQEEIARLAYGYWHARGRSGGDPLEDWVRAENEYYASRAG
jgi:hypothetical protein